MKSHLRPKESFKPKRCIGCGVEFHTRHYDQMYCSKACGFKSPLMAVNVRLHDEVWVHRSWVKHVRSSLGKQATIRRKAERYENRHIGRSTDVECKECAECSSLYYSATWKGQKYCSQTCAGRSASRKGKHRHRARMKEAYVEPVDANVVFESANWHCSWCKIPTLKDKRGSIDMDAPELDHVIPLSKGGEHSYANVQLLCRSCNGTKSDWTDLELTG